MDYELIIKLLSVFITGLVGSILWNTRKIYEIHINSKKKELHIKKDMDGHYELEATGYFVEDEILRVIQQLNVQNSQTTSLQVIKLEKNR